MMTMRVQVKVSIHGIFLPYASPDCKTTAVTRLHADNHYIYCQPAPAHTATFTQ